MSVDFPYEPDDASAESREASTRAIVRMTETVLAQHDKILEMNARLLAVLAAPVMVVRDPNDKGWQ